MPTAADLEEHAIWKLEQARYAVTIHPGYGYIVTAPSGHVIATPTSVNELRALADQCYALVWLGYRRVETALPPESRLLYSWNMRYPFRSIGLIESAPT